MPLIARLVAVAGLALVGSAPVPEEQPIAAAAAVQAAATAVDMLAIDPHSYDHAPDEKIFPIAAAGIAIASQLPEEQQQAILDFIDPAKVNPETVSDLISLVTPTEAESDIRDAVNDLHGLLVLMHSHGFVAPGEGAWAAGLADTLTQSVKWFEDHVETHVESELIKPAEAALADAGLEVELTGIVPAVKDQFKMLTELLLTASTLLKGELPTHEQVSALIISSGFVPDEATKDIKEAVEDLHELLTELVSSGFVPPGDGAWAAGLSDAITKGLDWFATHVKDELTEQLIDPASAELELDLSGLVPAIESQFATIAEMLSAFASMAAPAADPQA